MSMVVAGVVAPAATAEIEVERMQVIVVAGMKGAAVATISQEMSDVNKDRGGDKLSQPPRTAHISSTSQPPRTAHISSTVSTTAQITILVTGTTHVS
jgi:hypothetical protein